MTPFTPTHQPARTRVHFCRHCGQPTQQRTPDGDTRTRAVCPACGTIHYVNPLVVVGTVPYLGDKILLCRRNIEPCIGQWTLPAGFMELGETAQAGAARETREEAGAAFDMGALFGVMSVPHVGQVHLFYLCALHHDQFHPGHETQEARLFAEHDLPWDALAFRTVAHTIRAYWADFHAQQGFGVHTHDF